MSIGNDANQDADNIFFAIALLRDRTRRNERLSRADVRRFAAGVNNIMGTRVTDLNPRYEESGDLYDGTGNDAGQLTINYDELFFAHPRLQQVAALSDAELEQFRVQNNGSEAGVAGTSSGMETAEEVAVNQSRSSRDSGFESTDSTAGQRSGSRSPDGHPPGVMDGRAETSNTPRSRAGNQRGRNSSNTGSRSGNQSAQWSRRQRS